MTGTSTEATSPAAKPLLYRLSPACSVPTESAAEECTSPATTPQCQPKRPAMGASVVPNSAASTIDGSAAPNGLNSDPRNTPAMIGAMFHGCFPNAAKPTMVSMAPMTGPLRSPPTAST